MLEIQTNFCQVFATGETVLPLQEWLLKEEIYPEFIFHASAFTYHALFTMAEGEKIRNYIDSLEDTK